MINARPLTVRRMAISAIFMDPTRPNMGTRASRDISSIDIWVLFIEK